jgi:hypothetical protein
MSPENRKHPSLVVGREMEEAVPRKQATVWFAEREASHVGDKPPMPGEALAAPCN